MPPRSEAQRRAMHAAASGQSTLGIPKKVAREFVHEDEGGHLPEKLTLKQAAKIVRNRRRKHKRSGAM